jgi:hypothetical protein
MKGHSQVRRYRSRDPNWVLPNGSRVTAACLVDKYREVNLENLARAYFNRCAHSDSKGFSRVTSRGNTEHWFILPTLFLVFPIVSGTFHVHDVSGVGSSPFFGLLVVMLGDFYYSFLFYFT